MQIRIGGGEVALRRGIIEEKVERYRLSRPEEVSAWSRAAKSRRP